MLEARELIAGYGASLVIQGISFEVAAGEVVCLLGRNGVGKTTTLRAVMGMIRPRAGRVTLAGEDITGRPPFRMPVEASATCPTTGARDAGNCTS